MNGKIITIIITVVLIAYILLKINVNSLFNAIFQLNPLYIIIFVAGLSLSFILKAMQWQALINIFRKIKLYPVYIFVVLSNISGKLTPGNLGEFYRGELLHKNSDIQRSKAYSTVLIDKIISLFTIFIIVALTLILYYNSFDLETLILIAMIFFIFVFGVLIVRMTLYDLRINRFIIKFIPKKSKDYVSSKIENIKEAVNIIEKNKVIIIISMFWSIIYWISSCLILWILLLGFGVSINFLYFMTATLITMIITMIPITISGFGAREVSLLFFFEKIGVPAEITITYSLVGYVLNILTLMFLNIIIKKDTIKL